MKHINLEAGDPAPWFKQRSPSNPEFSFNTIAGRYVVLCFFPSSTNPVGQIALDTLQQRRHYFDDKNMMFFGVTLDTKDETEQRLKNVVPGIRFFFDVDGHVSRLYGALPFDLPADATETSFRPLWVVLDRMLRVIANIPFTAAGTHADKLIQVLDDLPPHRGVPEPDLIPPILTLPNVFSLDLCRHLIALYEADGGYDSGFMNQARDKTLGVIDYSHKRRRDYEIEDQQLITSLNNIMRRRLAPEIAKAFQFHVTHAERHIVACYKAEDGGHFNAHRDNTTVGTAHRRFAVTFNLNDDFDGGELSFPEFGKRSYRASVGGAIVFSCSLMHEAGVVTRGTRYAYLPFLYDEAAAKIRDKNRSAIVPASSAASTAQ